MRIFGWFSLGDELKWIKLRLVVPENVKEEMESTLVGRKKYIFLLERGKKKFDDVERKMR